MSILPPIPAPEQPPAPAAQQVRLAALQASRAASMEHTVGAEYQQPIHPFLAEKLPENPELHRQVVLPGAERAIHLDALEAYHEHGLDERAIVVDINTATGIALSSRRANFREWRDGELHPRLQRAHERAARRISYQHERDMEIEKRLDAELGELS